MRFAFLVIPAFLLIIPLIHTNFFAYATDQTIIPTGAVVQDQCHILNGTIINQTINSQTTPFCKFESRFLLYFPHYIGTTMPALSPWIDRHTGITYTFVDVATTPIFKNVTGTYYIGERLFNISARSTGQIAGNDLILVPQLKKIEIISWGKTSNNSLMISFPNDLISGDINVLVDGNTSDSSIKKTDTMTTVTTKLDFSIGTQEVSNPNPGFDPYYGFKWKKVEITGTEIAPEFPYSFFILILGIAGMLGIKYKQYNNSS